MIGAPVVFAVGDHRVDHVAAEAGIARAVDGLLDDLALLFGRREEEGDVAHEVGLGGVELCNDLRTVGKCGPEFVEGGADGDGADLGIELGQLLAARLVDARHLLEDLLQLLLQALDLLLDVLLHGFGQGVEDLRLDDLAFVHRRHREAGRRAQDGDVLLLRLLVQRLEGFLLTGAEAFVDGAPACLIIVALERCGNGLA